MNRQNHNTRAGGAASFSQKPPCEVAALLPRLRTVRATLTKADAAWVKPMGADRPDRFLQDLLQRCEDEEQALQDTIAISRASSFDGVAVQLLEMARRLRILSEFAPVQRESLEGRELRALYRLLFSVLGMIEGHSSSSLEGLVDEAFIARELNPWLSPEARQAAEDLQLLPHTASPPTEAVGA